MNDSKTEKLFMFLVAAIALAGFAAVASVIVVWSVWAIKDLLRVMS